MNALRLVDPKNAWIVKPLDRVNTRVSDLYNFKFLKIVALNCGTPYNKLYQQESAAQ